MSEGQHNIDLPRIGLTMGDPLGVGPEIVVKALSDPALRRLARFQIYGLNEAMTYAADTCGIDTFWYRIDAKSERRNQPIAPGVVVIDMDCGDETGRMTPKATRWSGMASKTFVETAISDAMADAGDPRKIDALVTAPICKEAWSLAGFKWPGHTELLTNRTRSKRSAMMFVSPRLKVALATTHIPLMDIRNELTIGRVYDPIDLGNQLCRRLGIERPRIAVTGLNPHAGESGLIGDEDVRIIAPAIEVAREHGIDASGPHPADTVFIKAASNEYDLVVAMYHDQGLIPVKLLGWDKAVNVTVGLPFVRTSPDHGTAFDIAGQGRASESSMKAAIELAIDLTAPAPRDTSHAQGEVDS
ncbi:MAG: 4-hydroxythreonine-4-phosphate dehydrogenase PdxA [Phycisphaerae bacterium]|nr:4-hydroxythreonine-4-phosphate dehydrogenase PdxA [Phycisphaerae bacterium]